MNIPINTVAADYNVLKLFSSSSLVVVVVVVVVGGRRPGGDVLPSYVVDRHTA